jgi:hypothetical protein
VKQVCGLLLGQLKRKPQVEQVVYLSVVGGYRCARWRPEPLNRPEEDGLHGERAICRFAAQRSAQLWTGLVVRIVQVCERVMELALELLAGNHVQLAHIWNSMGVDTSLAVC